MIWITFWDKAESEDKEMTYRDAINNLMKARSIPYRKATFIKIKELLKALEQEPKWIPVSERVPKKVGTYMTTVDYGRYGLATGQRYYHGKRLGWEDECVVAWMPLPEPYNHRKGANE